MQEIWKDIEGYTGLYQVSSPGNIKSLSRKVWNGKVFFSTPEKIIKFIPVGKGYQTVCLSKNGKVKSFYVHRLVAEAFLDNTECKKTVNHINGNKLDNTVDNLEWATYSENLGHKYKTLGYRDSLETKAKKSLSKMGIKNPAYRHGQRCGSHGQSLVMGD